MAVEHLFPHFKDSSPPASALYDPNDPGSYEAYLQRMMADSRDYEDSILAGDRSEAALYYAGYEPSMDYTERDGPYRGENPNQTLGELLDQDKKNTVNRSTFVSTDVKDAIMLMMPALIRLFGASESPVFLVPRSEADSDMAEQATQYVNYTFWNDNPGFLILHGAIKDAMTVRTGFVKWWSEDQQEFRIKRFSNITAEQLQMLLAEDTTARVVELGPPVKQHAPITSMAGASAGPAAAPNNPPLQAPPMGGQSPAPGSAGIGQPGGASPQGASSLLSGGASLGAPPNGALGPANASNAPPGGPMGQGPGAVGAGIGGSMAGPLGPMAGAPPLPPVVYSHAIIRYEVSKPLIKVAGVPPEEMRIDRYARSFKESRLVGHERLVPADQLIAQGYDRELVEDHIQTSESTFTVEPQLRNPGRFMGTRMGDGCKFGEWYIKVDKDGDGIPELRCIRTIGQDREIVSDEEVNRVKIALFSVDPIPHTIVGDSLTDYTKDMQRIKTNLMRAILDSAAESINPKTVINELLVNPDDAMNDDLGAVIRTKGNPGDTVMPFNIPFLGQQMMPVVEMLNNALARRTGLTDAAKGLDPKALQSSTMIGVEAVINGAQERVELVARVLCETGFKDLFVGLFNEICENPNQQRTLKINGKWTPFDTSTFDASMSCEVNPNLGKGSDMVRMLALQQIDQKQQILVNQLGLNNPICGVMEMLNTQTDMLALANVKNVGRYFRTPNPAQLQAMTNAPKPPDPMLLAAQAQMERVRSTTAEAVGKQQIERDKMEAETQFKHKQLDAKTAYDFQKLDLEGQKAGIDHHVALAQLAGQLMKNQQDSDQADQQSQLNMADAQQKSDQAAQQGMQAQNDAQLKAAQLASQHLQKMHQIGAQHTQAMTQLATQHHQAMTGHGMKGAQIVAGALSQGLDHEHEAQQAELDRRHQTETTEAMLGSQQKIASMKPRPSSGH